MRSVLTALLAVLVLSASAWSAVCDLSCSLPHGSRCEAAKLAATQGEHPPSEMGEPGAQSEDMAGMNMDQDEHATHSMAGVATEGASETDLVSTRMTHSACAHETCSQKPQLAQSGVEQHSFASLEACDNAAVELAPPDRPITASGWESSPPPSGSFVVSSAILRV
jgi:hypothetical protein